MKRSTLRAAVCAAALAACAAVLVGCGAPSGLTQSWDITEGRYLTEEEYKKLSKDEAYEYCEKLAQEIDIQNDNAAAANSMMTDIDSELAGLKRQLADARAANQPLDAQIADLERRIRELNELPRSYTVIRDDFLIKISTKNRIYGDGTKWKRIFRGNREKIEDPNLIYPDQIFLIPRGLPTTHTVVEGETLRIIAGYWEVFGDRNLSGRLYEANRDQIRDPNVIRPRMVLTIPR